MGCSDDVEDVVRWKGVGKNKKEITRGYEWAVQVTKRKK